MDHPHLHCLVTGGGLSADGRKWIGSRKGFFVPVRVLSALYRGKFLAYLKQAQASGDLVFPGEVSGLKEPGAFRKLLATLYEKSWNVYCKRPFGSAERVVKYFGRYTHRVAISNERIIGFDGKTVVLRLAAGEGEDRRRTLKLKAEEFIRRYLFHVLPDRFVKIRYYGILGNCRRVETPGAMPATAGMPSATQAQGSHREARLAQDVFRIDQHRPESVLGLWRQDDSAFGVRQAICLRFATVEGHPAANILMRY